MPIPKAPGSTRTMSAKEKATKKAYNARPENIKRRAANNKLRRESIKEGRASVGDGKDVAHVKAMDAGGSLTGEATVQNRKTNRGWRAKNPKMYTKGKT